MSDYRVLARAYRPQTFEDLRGQDVLVRTLTNAIARDRIAHAFVLTGIRGIGKTTTARIIAKSLNCLGADGAQDSATATPCNECANCVQIREDRHVDVLEMDAASRTGVSDMREIIDSVHYKPVSARYKVYIIDEAHMLSNSAFNALLKTLEEPPEHVVFIFATTEIRKIPVTILSRCQRFDLRRLSVEETVDHLRMICKREEVKAEDNGLELIAIAAEGSVRDALSLLDQAIAHSVQAADGGTVIDTAMVRDLIGLVDRSQLYTMLRHLFKGETEPALELLAQQYHQGANMVVLLQELMQAVHVVTRLIISKNYALNRTYSPHEEQLLVDLAASLSVGATTKAWQLLLKGLEEVKHAPDSLMATEMVFVRFTYSAQLPDPSDILKRLKNKNAGTSQQNAAPTNAGSAPQATMLHFPTRTGAGAALAVDAQVQPVDMPPAPAPSAATLSLVSPSAVVERNVDTFEAIVALCEQEREARLAYHLKHEAYVVSCRAGELVLSARSPITQEQLSALALFLGEQSGQVWRIYKDEAAGEASIAEREALAKQQRIDAASQHPVVAAVLETFPESSIVDISSSDNGKDTA